MKRIARWSVVYEDDAIGPAESDPPSDREENADEYDRATARKPQPPRPDAPDRIAADARVGHALRPQAYAAMILQQVKQLKRVPLGTGEQVGQRIDQMDDRLRHAFDLPSREASSG